MKWTRAYVVLYKIRNKIKCWHSEWIGWNERANEKQHNQWHRIPEDHIHSARHIGAAHHQHQHIYTKSYKQFVVPLLYSALLCFAFFIMYNFNSLLCLCWPHTINNNVGRTNRSTLYRFDLIWMQHKTHDCFVMTVSTDRTLSATLGFSCVTVWAALNEMRHVKFF